MRTKIAILLAWLLSVLFLAMPLEAADPTAAGLWAQTDDDGHVGAWFLIFEQNGLYEGAIAKMFPRPGEDPNPICTRCSGDQKNMPSFGLILIKGMERNGLVYKNGTILDPRDGKIYSARMEVSPDGEELTVRGYLGIPAFGKSQVWKRLPDDSLPAEETPPNLLPFLPRQG